MELEHDKRIEKGQARIYMKDLAHRRAYEKVAARHTQYADGRRGERGGSCVAVDAFAGVGDLFTAGPYSDRCPAVDL